MRLLAAGVILGAAVACGGNAPRTSQNEDSTRKTSSGSPAESPESPDANAPKGRIISLSDSMLVHGGTDTLRFGHLRSGEIAVLRFRIENSAAKPVVLVSTQRSCGCISLDHDNQPIAPGKTQTMEMSFDSRGEFGWQLKRMDLLFAGSKKPLRIFVEADIE